MRIVVTLPWGERLGGAEAMFQGILEGHGDGEHELEPVFFKDGPWPVELRERGFRVEVIDAGRMRQAQRWPSTIRTLTSLLRSRRPDLILNWSATTHLYASPAAVLAGMRDRVVWWQQAIPERDWVDVAATLLPAAAIGCYSHAAERAQQQLRPRRPTFVVGAGSPLPDPAERPAEIELPGDVPIVGLVGRLQPWKGQDRLLRAQALLHARGVRMHLLMVGGDSYGLSPEYAASLAPLARSLGLEGSVTMTGEVPDAGPYIRRTDVLVNASDPEPFGIVILEGMARHVAVLGVNSGGPSEFVHDGRTGALARSGRPEDLADALEPLLRSQELRARLAAAGQEEYERLYTTAAMRGRFFAQIDAVVTGDGRSARSGSGATPTLR